VAGTLLSWGGCQRPSWPHPPLLTRTLLHRPPPPGLPAAPTTQDASDPDYDSGGDCAMADSDAGSDDDSQQPGGSGSKVGAARGVLLERWVPLR